MKRLFQAILQLGVRPEQSSFEQRRIKTVNLLNMVTLFFLLIGISNYVFLKQDYPIVPEVVFMGLAITSLWLSHAGKTEAAFLVFTVYVNLSLLFIVLYYPFESGSYLFYFPLIVSVILLNNITSRGWMALVHIVVSVCGFLLALFLNKPQWSLKGLGPDAVSKLWYYNIIMSAGITAMVSGLLNRLIALQNKEIMAQNSTLLKAKEEISTSLKGKEVLLAELNHRVKNNLAVITGLLNLQMEGSTNHETRQVINDSRNRIMSMALVHRMLYSHPQIEEIDLGRYSAELIRELLNSFNLPHQVQLHEHYDHISLPVNKSIPFGLILNEVVTNSIKYVFRDANGRGSSLHVILRLNQNDVSMVVKDSGSGFPKDMNAETSDGSLGIFLIKTLAGQIDGKVRFSNEPGAKVELSFPLN
ncbi:MAG TPA: sensor histidine kinase [Bacteroidia bacterium]|nr:sensor histidine kinase [Bacteroidia bacterium]